MKKKTYACLQTAVHISHLCVHNSSSFKEYILFYFLVEERTPERKPFTRYNSGKDKALYLGHWRVNTVWLNMPAAAWGHKYPPTKCMLKWVLLPVNRFFVWLEFTVVVFECNILKYYESMVCFYTYWNWNVLSSGFLHSSPVQHWKTFTPWHQHGQQHGLWDRHFPLRGRDSCALPASAGTITGREEGEGGGEKGSERWGVSRAEEGAGGGEEGRLPHGDHERERGVCGAQRGLPL